jgi:hypothetical protein
VHQLELKKTLSGWRRTPVEGSHECVRVQANLLMSIKKNDLSFFPSKFLSFGEFFQAFLHIPIYFTFKWRLSLVDR